MSAEVETGASAGRGGFGALARIRADLQGTFQTAGETGRMYAERICSWLEDISHRLDALDTSEERAIIIEQAALTGAGAAVEIDAPRPGWDWTIDNIAVVQQTVAATVASLFIGTRQAAGLRWRSATNADGRTTDKQMNLWAPDGSKMWLEIAGDQAGGAVTVILQITMLRKSAPPPEPYRV